MWLDRKVFLRVVLSFSRAHDVEATEQFFWGGEGRGRDAVA